MAQHELVPHEPFVTFRLSRWPPVPSNSIIPILLAAPMVMAWLPPTAIRPVKPTSPAVYGGGGTKKSEALTAVPLGVTTVSLPEEAPVGTVVDSAVAVAV